MQGENHQAPYSYHRERFKRTRRAGEIVEKTTIVLMILILIAVFFGLREIMASGTGVHGAIIPASLSLGGAVLFGVTWHVLFANAPLVESYRNTIIIFALIVLSIQVMFSAWPVTVAIGGSAAVSAHMSEYKRSGSHALSSAFARARSPEDLIGLAKREAESYGAHGRLEASSGVISGRAGSGTLSAALIAYSERLLDSARHMKEALENAQQEAEAGSRILREMDGLIADAAMPSMDRQKRFSDLAGKLGSVVGALNQVNLTAQLSGLIGGVAYRSASAAESEIRRSVDRFGEEIRLKAQRAQSTEGPIQVLEPFVPMNPGLAVFDYAHMIWPAWILAVGIDCLPLVMLIVISLLYLDCRTHRREADYWGSPEPGLLASPPVGPQPPPRRPPLANVVSIDGQRSGDT